MKLHLLDSWRKLKTNEKWTLSMSAIAIVVSLIAISTENSSSASLIEIEKAANDLDALLLRNTERELEMEKKRISSDTINSLYKDFYQFGHHNVEVIRKLEDKEPIVEPFNLKLFLNGFEDLYEKCKTGIISREQVRINFQHLIGISCNNTQVEQVAETGYNGLKLFCYSFYPDSRLAKKARTENYSCR